MRNSHKYIYILSEMDPQIDFMEQNQHIMNQALAFSGERTKVIVRNLPLTTYLNELYYSFSAVGRIIELETKVATETHSLTAAIEYETYMEAYNTVMFFNRAIINGNFLQVQFLFQEQSQQSMEIQSLNQSLNTTFSLNKELELENSQMDILFEQRFDPIIYEGWK